jgi:translation initiation factor 2-alpha kinase 3
MELCKETLHDFIERRNSEVSGKIADFLVEKELDILKIFLQICKGLDFIHSKENLIHRDLKPKNIFFTEEGKIKLGDFGLATKSSLTSSLTASSPINLTPSPIDINLKTSPTESSATRFTFDTSFTSEYHTKNIGTLLYAAPEQIKQNYYDQKVNFRII